MRFNSLQFPDFSDYSVMVSTRALGAGSLGSSPSGPTKVFHCMEGKIVRFIFWLVVTCGVLTITTTMISAPSTVELLVGLTALVLYGWISYRTRCFTNWFKSKKK